ncbi:hypothetical protein F2Q68_00010902 [Brassica cretica]|uniref:Uncharacterized protein n=1 Tax=Brassica cretica TaxID=69181 RepID=A0A8S9KLX6_BRACR|nr:hypothetical protein F2Q68_00010902 [Brassica cretica]
MARVLSAAELPCIHDKPSTQALNQALQKETNFNTSSDSLFENKPLWPLNYLLPNLIIHSNTIAGKDMFFHMLTVFWIEDRLRTIGGHLNLTAEEKAPKRNVGVVWSTNKNGRGGPLMDLVDDLNPGT